MKKKLSRFILISFTTAFTFAAAVTSTIAWFNTGNDIDFGVGDEGHITATTNGGYFGKLANGTGTYGYSSTNPYVISTPKHLYNLAWLQYIGYFNTVKYDANPVVKSIQQCYFTVANDIDMDGMILPPIGTELYPFFGYFNGGGYTISNVKISNDDPTSSTSSFSNQIAKPSDSVFAKLPSNYIPRVVGFFGAIGDIHTINTSIEASDYSSLTPSMINITIKDITVESKTSQTLIGLAAGYVDGNMNGVKVAGESTIDLGSGNKTSIPNLLTTNLTDYGLVGFTNNEGSSGTFTQKLSEFYDNKDLQASSGSNWGGSLNFREFAQRIFTIIGGGSGTGVTQTNTGTNQNPSYYWTYADNNNKVSVAMQTGDITENPDSPTNRNKKLTYNCNTNTVMPFSVYTQDDFDDAPTYSLESYQVNDLVKYNNNYYRCTVAIESENGETWNPNHWAQVSKYEAKPTNTGYIVGSGSQRSGSLKIASSPQGFIGASLARSGSTSTSVSYTSTSNSGAYTEILTPTTPGSSPSGTAKTDFCVIKDSYNESAIDEGNTNLPTASSGKLNGYPIKTLQDLGFDKTKKYSKSRKTLHQTFLSSNNVQGLRFDTFTVAYNKTVTVTNPFVTRINDNSSSDIGDNKTANANSSYVFLQGSVEFNLKKNGYINFFGGNYTNQGSGAGTFFKLFSVNRASNTSISSVNQIYEVWTNTNTQTSEQYPFIYTNTNTTTTPTSSQIIEIGYSKANVTPGVKKFDSRYLYESSLVSNALYYFEIPVNSGEFCIGSTGNAGGYLLYLDIGASEIDNKDRVTAYSITTIRTGNVYPIGVDFAVKNATGNGGQTFGVYIASNKSGSIVFSVETEGSDNYVGVTSTSSLSVYSYQGSLFSASDPPSTNFVVTGDTIGALESTNPVGGERVLTITVEPAKGGASTTVTVIDQLNSDGSFSESASHYYIEGEECDKADIDDISSELSTTILDGTFRTLHLNSILTRAGSSGYEFSVSYLIDSVHCDYSDKEIDVTIDTNSTSMAITVESNYFLYIDGTQYFTGNTYPNS